MSHWVLNKEQKGGSGGLLVAQDGFLPKPSKIGLFKRACSHPLMPAQLEKFTQNILLLSLQLGRIGPLCDALCLKKTVAPSKECFFLVHFLYAFIIQYILELIGYSQPVFNIFQLNSCFCANRQVFFSFSEAVKTIINQSLFQTLDKGGILN